MPLYDVAYSLDLECAAIHYESDGAKKVVFRFNSYFTDLTESVVVQRSADCAVLHGAFDAGRRSADRDNVRTKPLGGYFRVGHNSPTNAA